MSHLNCPAALQLHQTDLSLWEGVSPQPRERPKVQAFLCVESFFFFSFNDIQFHEA